MADDLGNQNAEDSTKSKVPKRRGLPPMSPKSAAGDNGTEIRQVKRKVKKKQTENEMNQQPNNKLEPDEAETEEAAKIQKEQSDQKPTPRRRRKRSPSQENTIDEVAPVAAVSTPRKKKKKPRTENTEDNKSQNSLTADAAQFKEAQGSKTSLISKDEGTPRKKAQRKKKKAKKATVDGDDFGDTPWAEDLRTMREDIIVTNGLKKDETGELGTIGEEKKKQPLQSLLTTPILRSQPLDKIFIETSSRFKGTSKTVLSRQRIEETTKPVEPVIFTRKTTIDFALGSHKIFRVLTLFLHGLTAGLALWQMVMIFTLSSFTSDDFLLHYYRISLPLQCSYYFLLILCTVSMCDRFDIGNPTRRFVLRALTLQNGAVAIIFSLVALILTIISIRYDDKMYLYKEFPDLFKDNSTKTSDISSFQSINTARSVFIMLSWLVLAITPNSDRLEKNLKSGETGLERDLEMDKVSSA